MTATRHLHQLVGAERLLVEPGGVAEVPRSIERIVRIFGRQPLGIDPEILEQSRRNRPIRPRTADQQRAAVDQQCLAVDDAFVALRMSAEIVVIVEDQDARAGLLGTQEPGGRRWEENTSELQTLMHTTYTVF